MHSVAPEAIWKWEVQNFWCTPTFLWSPYRGDQHHRKVGTQQKLLEPRGKQAFKSQWETCNIKVCLFSWQCKQATSVGLEQNQCYFSTAIFMSILLFCPPLINGWAVAIRCRLSVCPWRVVLGWFVAKLCFPGLQSLLNTKVPYPRNSWYLSWPP